MKVALALVSVGASALVGAGVALSGPAQAATAVPQATAERTNFDWARLMLRDGGWPTSNNNVTVVTRWMDSEEPASDWYDRNNPLNNGLGSGGGAGLGAYKNLVIAAHYAAENLKGSSYRAVAADFTSSASIATTERAIWDSPWASSHYGYGKLWHSGSVPTVAAPASRW